jgi:translation initiation factor 3 subunit H
MVSGSLLGLVVQRPGENNSVLEISHSFPFPSENNSKSQNSNVENEEDVVVPTSASSAAMAAAAATVAGYDGHEYQMEMMRMLREVNVDNNCVGWYQSMYLGLHSTTAMLENQFNYQTELSPNSVVVLYDPMQTTRGKFVLKCYRLSDECIEHQNSNSNSYIPSQNIFEEIPVQLTNPGLVQAFLIDVADGLHTNASTPLSPTDSTLLDRLDLSTNPYLEKHLEFLSHHVEDLSTEQNKFQYFARQLTRSQNAKAKNKPEVDGWSSADAPRRLDSVLLTNQIRTYLDQMDELTGDGLTKLFLTSGLQSSSKQPLP